MGIALLLSAAVVGCASAAPHGRVYVRVGPPPAVIEARGSSPGLGRVWVGGYHQWSGDRYVWVSGRWAVPPRPRVVWVPGHWQLSRHGYDWVDGHWR